MRDADARARPPASAPFPSPTGRRRRPPRFPRDRCADLWNSPLPVVYTRTITDPDGGVRLTGRPGSYVTIEETVRGFKEITEGLHDDKPEQAFYMMGPIEDVVKKTEELKAE